MTGGQDDYSALLTTFKLAYIIKISDAVKCIAPHSFNVSYLLVQQVSVCV